MSTRRPSSGPFDMASAQGRSAWRRAFLRAPQAEPGHTLLRARAGQVEVLSTRRWARSGDRFRQVDARRGQIVLAPQSIAAAEGIDVQVTAVLTARVTDPALFVQTAADPVAEVYLAVQIALRDAVARTPLETVLVRDLDLTPLQTAAESVAHGVGLEVLGVVLKDVSASRTVAEAREEELLVQITARAEMERARTEVKATRARLAAAQMLERSPMLARLRLLEALPEGTTLTLEGIGPLAAGTAAPDDAGDRGRVDS